MSNSLEKFLSLLDADGRTAKPRKGGITIVLDKGLGLSAVRDLGEASGPYCDYAKIAWGSALITGRLLDKIALYREFQITPKLGGTLFEYAHMRGRAEDLLGFVREHRLHLEISDGVAEIPRKEKLRWIERFAAVTEVFSEIGRKIGQETNTWAEMLKEDLAAGAGRIVIEGREIGPPGQEIREDLLDLIAATLPLERVVFEALERKQQVYLIKKFGPNVSLGNILPTDLMTLESFRLRLKEHTLLHRWPVA